MSVHQKRVSVSSSRRKGRKNAQKKPIRQVTRVAALGIERCGFSASIAATAVVSTPTNENDALTSALSMPRKWPVEPVIPARSEESGSVARPRRLHQSRRTVVVRPRSRFVPVAEADAVVVGRATEGDHERGENDAEEAYDLDRSRDDFCLAEAVKCRFAASADLRR